MAPARSAGEAAVVRETGTASPRCRLAHLWRLRAVFILLLLLSATPPLALPRALSAPGPQRSLRPASTHQLAHWRAARVQPPQGQVQRLARSAGCARATLAAHLAA